MTARWWPRVVTAVVLAAVAVPGVRLLVDGDEAPDGFPLSIYPMFTHDPGRVVEVPTVVVVSGDGDVRRLSPEVIADTDQVIEAKEVLRHAIAEGGATLDAFCREVAGRAAPPVGGEVQVVSERYDTVRWAEGDDEPSERRVLARCR